MEQAISESKTGRSTRSICSQIRCTSKPRSRRCRRALTSATIWAIPRIFLALPTIRVLLAIQTSVVVRAVGADAGSLQVGQRVFSLKPHQSAYIAHRSELMVPVPDGCFLGAGFTRVSGATWYGGDAARPI